jgi:hypothetical protein
MKNISEHLDMSINYFEIFSFRNGDAFSSSIFARGASNRMGELTPLPHTKQTIKKADAMQAWSRSASRRLTYQLAVSLRLRRDSISLPIVVIQASHKRLARQMTYSRLRSQYNPTSHFQQCYWMDDAVDVQIKLKPGLAKL